MIFSDRPIEELLHDRLDRSVAAKAMAQTIANPAVETPLTIGILGGWGTGKTSFMRLLEKQLIANRIHTGESASLDVILRFESWAYARQEQSLWRALLLRVIAATRENLDALAPENRDLVEKQASDLEASLYRSLILKETAGVSVNLSGAVPLVTDLALRVVTLGMSSSAGSTIFQTFKELFKQDDAREVANLIEKEYRERYVAEVKALDQFKSAFEHLLEVAGFGQNGKRLILFVDDLDRCLSEDAVAAIEAMKIFLDTQGCIFVLGMDPSVVESGIQLRYAEGAELAFEPSEYLDKVIQLPFRLPPLSETQIGRLISSIAQNDPTGHINEIKDLLALAAKDNPRSLKRAVNILLLSARIASHLENSGDPEWRRGLAKLVLLQTFCPSIHSAIVEDGPNSLKDSEREVVGMQDASGELKILLDGNLVSRDLLKAEPSYEDFADADLNDMIYLSLQM